MLRPKPVLEHLRRMAVAYVVLLVALVLTSIVTSVSIYSVYENVKDTTRARFDKTVRVTTDAIDRQLNFYVDAMRSARGLFYASDSVEEREWAGYTNGIGLQDRYKGMRILGYAKKVDPEEKNAFIESLSQTHHQDGRPDPTLRPKGERDVYFPMTYIQPLDDVNERLLGQDEYTDPERRAAMDQARDTGEPQSTGKVYLLSKAPAGDKADLALKPGLVVYLAIYRKGEPIDTVEQRRSALDGFVVGALDPEGLLRGSLEGLVDPKIDYEIYDGKKQTQNSLLYDNDQIQRADQPKEPADLLGTVEKIMGLSTNRAVGIPDISNRDQKIDVAGREWTLYFKALPGFEDSWASNLPYLVLVSGLVVSLLLFGTTLMLIRSRVRAEKTSWDLEEANRELEATNRELEAFSYSVSHDLRAPLRSIDGFSQILLEDYADELDEDGKDYLSRVRAASQRMGRLIDNLLGLSRVTRGAMNRERVDLSTLAEEVAEDLKEAGPERQVRFSIQEGLEVWGDARLLRVALENLIGNAWKFTGKEPKAEIQFGVDEELSRRGRVPVYYVRDNGAGFEMAYANKLFGAFQRLHGADEFEGTGIGLATVQRIIRRHGGRIWAEGEVGCGATFYFTLRPGLRLEEEGKAK